VFGLAVQALLRANLVTDTGQTVPAVAVQLAQTLVPALIQGTILIDPTNSTGVATPQGSRTATVQQAGNTAATGPVFDKWSSLVQAWGTYAPLLTQNTTIVFASSHPDNTDPVIWAPFVARGAQVSMVGAAPIVTFSGALSGVTPKNRSAGSNSLLTASLVGVTAGSRIQNVSHPSSAFVYKSLGAGSFNVTQPMQSTGGAGGNPIPNEVDTWANGDNYQVQSLTVVNLAYIAPVCVDGLVSGITLWQIHGKSPGGDSLFIDASAAPVNIFECVLDRTVTWYAGVMGLQSANVFYSGGLNGVGEALIVGGAFPTGMTTCQLSGNNYWILLDGDLIVGTAQASFTGNIVLGAVAIDGVTAVFAVAAVQQGQLNYGVASTYGTANGNLNFAGNSHFSLDGGQGLTFTNTWTAPTIVASGVRLGSALAGNSVTGAFAFAGGITLTPAHLDAAAGASGFGGAAFQFGSGNTISNAFT
jgi:hypothetical protein